MSEKLSTYLSIDIISEFSEFKPAALNTVFGCSHNNRPQLKALRFCSIATPFSSIAFFRESISIGRSSF